MNEHTRPIINITPFELSRTLHRINPRAVQMAQTDPTALVTDPFLQTLLQTSSTARTSALSLLHPLSSEASSASTSAAAHKRLTASLSNLRLLNRRLAYNLRRTKADTSTSRSRIDTLHLGLQNLYYESRHLAGEIAGCEGWPHAYADLPMIGEAEFLAEFPEWEARRGEGEMGRASDRVGEDDMEVVEGDGAGAGGEDNHGGHIVSGTATGEVENEDIESALMRARIEHEYQVRVQLEEERKSLVAKRLELVKENAKRKEELQQLDGEMEAFIKAAEPIQRRFEKEWS